MKTIITPAKAQHILDTNIINRKVTPSMVEFLKAELVAGRFNYNGESIIISDTHKLMDGQHRLLACVESGIPITVNLVQDVPEESMPTIDTGRARSSGDVFSIYKIAHPRIVSGATKQILDKLGKSARTGEKRIHGRIKISNQEILEFYNEHSDILDALTTFSTHLYSVGAKLISPVQLVSYMYLLRDEDERMSIDFFREVMTGVSLSKSNVAYRLRTKLINDKMSISSMRQPAKRDLIIKAFSKYAEGKVIKSLGVSPKEWIKLDVDQNTEPKIDRDYLSAHSVS